VAVAKDGRIVYARAYGEMDDAGTAVQVDTRFRFASISKVITAAAVLQLIQAGAMNLDDSVFRLLADDLPLGDNPDPRLGRITVRMLLDHTSGFTKSTDPFFPEQPRVRQVFGPSGPKSCIEAARWFVTLPLATTPGSTFAYVNMNYCLLSLLVEKFTGEPYDKVVQSLVLERRNIHDARIGASFGRKPDEVAYPAANGTFLESLSGAGGWLGSAVDLARFIDGLDPDKPGQHLLKPTTYAQMITPGQGSWGLGVEVFPNGAWGHTGSLAGARAMAFHQPDGITWSNDVNGEFENHNVVLRDLMGRALGTVTTDWPAWDYSPELP
jgi:CubicO group peptidase (beta-lactamase class C family)